MDFYDKLITAIICVIVTFICVFNTFCFAETEITLNPLYDLYFKYENSTFNVVSLEGSKTYYFRSIPNHSYKIINNSDVLVTGLGGLDNIPSSGSTYEYIVNVNSGQTKVFNSFDYDYIWIYSSSSEKFPDVTIIDISVGFDGAIISLVENVGIENIWNTFEISLPYVGVVVLAGFGFYLIFHNIKELSKGREKMN